MEGVRAAAERMVGMVIFPAELFCVFTGATGVRSVSFVLPRLGSCGRSMIQDDTEQHSWSKDDFSIYGERTKKSLILELVITGVITEGTSSRGAGLVVVEQHTCEEGSA